jgi:hypothetical protein
MHGEGHNESDNQARDRTRFVELGAPGNLAVGPGLHERINDLFAFFRILLIVVVLAYSLRKAGTLATDGRCGSRDL